MSRPLFPLSALFFATLAAFASGPAQAAQPPRYTIQLLADLPGGISSSQGMSVNKLGVVGGQSVGTDGYFATNWTPPGQTPVSLGDLPGGSTSSMVYGLNDHGVAVGTASATTGGRAFRTNANGQLVDLGDLAGGVNASGAWAINNHGQVAGYSYSSKSGNNPSAVLWNEQGVATEIGDLAGGSWSSQARAINDNGLVAGSSNVATGKHAFAWTAAGGMTDLGDLAGGLDFSEAAGINNQGWVVGYGTGGTANGGAGTLHATLWRDGQVIDLTGNSAITSSANDVNDLGVIVGQSSYNAAIWFGTQGAIDLNSLVDNLPERFYLNNALSINELGQITGYGNNAAGQRVGFLLTEVSAVPEPASWTLTLMGLAVVTCLGQRRIGSRS